MKGTYKRHFFNLNYLKNVFQLYNKISARRHFFLGTTYSGGIFFQEAFFLGGIFSRRHFFPDSLWLGVLIKLVHLKRSPTVISVAYSFLQRVFMFVMLVIWVHYRFLKQILSHISELCIALFTEEPQIYSLITSAKVVYSICGHLSVCLSVCLFVSRITLISNNHNYFEKKNPQQGSNLICLI